MNRRSKRKKQSRLVKVFLTVVMVLAAGTVAYLVAQHFHLFRTNITLGPRFSVRGIDVSNHNGHIDFDRVAASGYSFVYVKSSEGATHVDPSFRQNCKRAAQSGLKVGAYHFFRKNRDGEAQARNMLRTVGNLKLDLPLVIDIEDAQNVNTVPRSKVRQELVLMARALKRAGYRVMIYTNGNGVKDYYNSCFEDDDLWLCSLNDPARVSEKRHVIQQYSWWGDVPGVKGEVDLDVFMGNEREWERWVDK